VAAGAPRGLPRERVPAVGVIALDPSAGVLSHASRLEIARRSSTHNRLPACKLEIGDEIVTSEPSEFTEDPQKRSGIRREGP
jgi:hypothetical protein